VRMAQRPRRRTRIHVRAARVPTKMSTGTNHRAALPSFPAITRSSLSSRPISAPGDPRPLPPCCGTGRMDARSSYCTPEGRREAPRSRCRIHAVYEPQRQAYTIMPRLVNIYGVIRSRAGGARHPGAETPDCARMNRRWWTEALRRAERYCTSVSNGNAFVRGGSGRALGPRPCAALCGVPAPAPHHKPGTRACEDGAAIAPCRGSHAHAGRAAPAHTWSYQTRAHLCQTP